MGRLVSFCTLGGVHLSLFMEALKQRMETRDVFMPVRFVSLAGTVLCHTAQDQDPVWLRYSPYDWMCRLADLVAHDAHVCAYLRLCVARFRARRLLALYETGTQRSRVHMELKELDAFLERAGRMAMREARL